VNDRAGTITGRDLARRAGQPRGDDAANALGRLLAIKNDAEHGLSRVSRAKRETAIV